MGLFNKKNIEKSEPTREQREIRIQKLQEQKQLLGLKQQEIDIEKDIRQTKFNQSTAGKAYNFGAKVFGNLKARNNASSKVKSNLQRSSKSIYSDKESTSIYQQGQLKSNIKHYTEGFENPFLPRKKRK